MLVSSDKEKIEEIIKEINENNGAWVKLLDTGQKFFVKKSDEFLIGKLGLCLNKKELHIMLTIRDRVLKDTKKVIYVYPKNFFGIITKRENTKTQCKV